MRACAAASRCGCPYEGATGQDGLDDLRETLVGLIEELGIPREVSVTAAA
ncbi:MULTISPECIES: hypothetical protein [unclassified Frankia]